MIENTRKAFQETDDGLQAVIDAYRRERKQRNGSKFYFLGGRVVTEDIVGEMDDRYASNKQLVRADLGNTITSLSSAALHGTFSDCSNLKSVYLPNSLTSVNSYSFSRSGIKNITIPENVKQIGGEAFQGCQLLESISYKNKDAITAFGGGESEEGGYGDGVYSKCYKLTAESINDLLPSALTKIPVRVFAEDISLSCDAVFSDRIQSIGSEAFRQSGISSVTIGPNIEMIDSRAFSECNNLTSVSVPENVNKIGDGVFGYCSSLVSVYIENELDPEKDEYCGTAMFDGCENLETAVFASGKAKNVSDSMFRHCYKLSNVVLPSSISSIGFEAFMECSSLSTINFSNLLNLKYIGTQAFKDSKLTGSLEFVYQLIDIQEEAFANTEISSINIGNNVSCQDRSFAEMPNLKTVYFNGKVIPGYVISRSYNVDTFTLESNVLSIGDYAFTHGPDFWNSHLLSIELPNSVVSSFSSSTSNIGQWAFFGSRISSVTIPGKTRYQVQTARGYPWSIASHNQYGVIHCSDGDLSVHNGR